MKDEILFQTIERVATAFPWEKVQLSIDRRPAGVYEFHFWLSTNQETGADCCIAFGTTPEEAADKLIMTAGDRDPNHTREKKIRELEREIEKLKAKVYILPPYRAPGQLGYGEEVKQEAKPEPPAYTNIEAETQTVSSHES